MITRKYVVWDITRDISAVKMLRFSLEVMSMDRIRNEHIRGTEDDRYFGEDRLRWFRHVQWRDG